jgi:transcriptional regulator with XRE-family HTH domain
MENQETIPRGEVLKKLAECYKVPINYFYETDLPEVRSSDAARAWLYSLRELTTKGKDTVATQSNSQFDDETLEKIADRMRLRAKISRHK